MFTHILYFKLVRYSHLLDFVFLQKDVLIFPFFPEQEQVLCSYTFFLNAGYCLKCVFASCWFCLVILLCVMVCVCVCVCVCVWLSPGVSQSVIISPFEPSLLSREGPSMEITLMGVLKHSSRLNTWIVLDIWCCMFQEMLHGFFIQWLTINWANLTTSLWYYSICTDHNRAFFFFKTCFLSD